MLAGTVSRSANAQPVEGQCTAASRLPSAVALVRADATDEKPIP